MTTRSLLSLHNNLTLIYSVDSALHVWTTEDSTHPLTSSCTKPQPLHHERAHCESRTIFIQHPLNHYLRSSQTGRSKVLRSQGSHAVRPCQHVSSDFLKTEIFSVFKKYAFRRRVFESLSPVHMKTLKRWKNDNIPYRACVILVAYNVWNQRFRKPPFSSVHTYTTSQRHHHRGSLNNQAY